MVVYWCPPEHAIDGEPFELFVPMQGFVTTVQRMFYEEDDGEESQG